MLIKETITKILKRFDAALADTVPLVQQIQDNLHFFTDIFRDRLRDVVTEFAATDPRITFEERNGGFSLYFEGKNLFRVAVNKFSERAEVRIDGETRVIYHGNGGVVKRSDFNGHMNVLDNMMLVAFEENIRSHLEKQLSNL